MTTIEEYQAQKTQYEAELETVKRDIILTEQTIEQQKGIFVQQFGTDDITKLQEIAQQYQASIAQKENELALLTQR